MGQKMRKAVRSVSPLRYGVVMGVLMAIMGLIYGILFMLVGGAFMGMMGNANPDMAAAVGGGGVMFIVFGVIGGAIGGFVFGIIGAVIYNIVAGITGGIVIELAEP
jgi:hypothetical protein